MKKKAKKKWVVFRPRVVWIMTNGHSWSASYWGYTRPQAKKMREALRSDMKHGAACLREPKGLRWIRVRITEITPKRKARK